MNEIVKSQSSKLITDYKKQTKTRNWEVSYGGSDRFYLTTPEKDEFLKQILSGKDVVCINDIVLTRFFKYINQIKLDGIDYLVENL